VVQPTAASSATAGPQPSVTPIPAVAQFLPGARLVAQWNTPRIAANAPHFGYVSRAGSRATLQRFELARPDAQVTTVDVLQVNTLDKQTYATELIRSEVALYTDCAGPDTLSDNNQVFGATCLNRARQSVDMIVGYNEMEVIAITLVNAESSGETANSALRLAVQMLGF
jgi:hypothetical protein